MWPGLHVAWGDPGPYGKGEGSEGCDLGLIGMIVLMKKFQCLTH